MLVKTRGIIFKSIKFRDTSLILDIYTEELGLRSYIVNGVRKSKPSQHSAYYQLMNILDLVVYHQEDKDICRIKEVNWNLSYEKLPFEIERSSIGIFMLEVCRKSIRERETNTELFQFLYEWFLFIDQSKTKISNYHILFLIELAGYLGFAPALTGSEGKGYFDMMEGVFLNEPPAHAYYMKESETTLLKDFLKIERDSVHDLKLSRSSRSVFLHAMIDFYRIHVEHFNELKSLEVLKELWA